MSTSWIIWKLEDDLDYSSLDYTEQNNTEQKNAVQNNTEQNNTEQKNTVQGGKWSHLSAITRSENIFEILSLQGQHLI